MSDELIGQRFDVRDDGGELDPFFARDFRVIELTPRLVHVRNAVETYWMTRGRFDAALASGRITRSTKE